jgi:hypothetical protein
MPMPFTAIICAVKAAADPPGSLRANLAFAGQTLLEYQARQAAEAGASQVLIVVGSVTQALSRAIDRLSADAIPVTLVRDMVSLIREAPRNSDALLVGDGMAVPQHFYATMGAQDGNALLVVEDNAATANLERIDAQHRWAGLARIAPGLLFGTLDMIGEWDLELTLVRAAVQASYTPVAAPLDDVVDGRLALMERQADADLVTRNLLARPARPAGEAGAERYVLGPVATLLAPSLLRAQVPAMQVRIGAIALAAIGLLCALLFWPVIALLLCIAGIGISLTADRLAVLARRGGLDFWSTLAVEGLVVVALAALALGAGRGLEGLYLALLLAILTLFQRISGRTARWPWAVVTSGSACLLVLLATLGGYLMAGIVLAILCAILSVGAALLGAADADARAV